jgi:hypothetical protein
MFDSRRKFATCILCDAPELSVEHIFGGGLKARLWNMPNWRSFDQPRSAALGKVIAVNGGAPMISITSRLLCEECNHSFHGVMSRVLDPLPKLIHGNARNLTAENVSDLRRYFERIAYIVDVHTSNHQVSEAYRARPEHARNAPWRTSGPLYSLAERRDWHIHRPIASPEVYIGRHRGVLGINPMADTGQGPVFGPDGLSPSYKTFQVVIGQLAVVLRMGSNNPRIPSSAYRLLGSDPLNWPPVPDVDYEDYFALCEQPNHYGPWRHILRERVVRRRFEREWRQSKGQYSSDLERLGYSKG